MLEVAPVRVDGARRALRREHGEEAVELRIGDARCRRHGAASFRRRGCRPAWSRGTSGRAAPGSCGGRRRLRAGASRTRGAACAGSGRSAAGCSCRAACRGWTGTAPASAPRTSCGTRVADVERDPVRGLLAERHDALLVALAVHAHELLLEVDVGEVEEHRLARAQPRRVDELEQRAVAERKRPVALERVEQRLDVLRHRRVRQSPHAPRRERSLGHARRAERVAQERADRGELARDRRRRELAPVAPELRCVVGERACVDVVERGAALAEPRRERLEVEPVRAAGALGQGRRSQEALDGIHA